MGVNLPLLAFALVTRSSVSLTLYEAKPSFINRAAGWKIQKCQFEVTYIMISLHNCSSFIVTTKSWWGGTEEEEFQKTAFYFYFPSEVSVISLLDTMCISYSTHKEQKNMPGRRNIFCLSLPVKTSDELICVPSFQWKIHSSLSPHFILISHWWCQAGLTVSLLWSYKINNNQKCFPLVDDLTNGLYLERPLSALVSTAKLHGSRLKQFTRKLLPFLQNLA